MVAWEVELHDDVDAWFVKLCEQDPQSADLVEEAIDHLVREGPRLGRPWSIGSRDLATTT